MISLTKLGLNVFTRLAKESEIEKVIDCTESAIPWDTIIAQYQQDNDNYSRGLYLWSWREGLKEFHYYDHTITRKAQFDLYKVDFLIYQTLPTIPNLSHIGIREIRDHFYERRTKTIDTLSVYRFSKDIFDAHSATR